MRDVNYYYYYSLVGYGGTDIIYNLSSWFIIIIIIINHLVIPCGSRKDTQSNVDGMCRERNLPLHIQFNFSNKDTEIAHLLFKSVNHGYEEASIMYVMVENQREIELEIR